MTDQFSWPHLCMAFTDMLLRKNWQHVDFDFCNRVCLLEAWALESHRLGFVSCLFHEPCDLLQIT